MQLLQKSQEKRKPNNVDETVGKIVKIIRGYQGFSQEFLSEKVGVTFNQIQKYENGINRLSVSRLYEILQHLNFDIGVFFDLLDKELNSEYNGIQKTVNIEKQTIELVYLFEKIKDPQKRKEILQICREYDLFKK